MHGAPKLPLKGQKAYSIINVCVFVSENIPVGDGDVEGVDHPNTTTLLNSLIAPSI